MTSRWRFIAGLAWRESRTARRRLLLYMSSISLGVGALVAIDSIADNVRMAVRAQSRGIMGGDVSFSADRRFPDALRAVLDSAMAHGIYLRDRSTEPGCAGCLRVGTGLVEHTRRFIDVLEEAVCAAR